jgi:hypothetical protein
MTEEFLNTVAPQLAYTECNMACRGLSRARLHASDQKVSEGMWGEGGRGGWLLGWWIATVQLSRAQTLLAMMAFISDSNSLLMPHPRCAALCDDAIPILNFSTFTDYRF